MSPASGARADDALNPGDFVVFLDTLTVFGNVEPTDVVQDAPNKLAFNLAGTPASSGRSKARRCPTVRLPAATNWTRQATR